MTGPLDLEKGTLRIDRLLVPIKPREFFSSTLPLLVNEDASILQPIPVFNLACVQLTEQTLTRIPLEG